MCLRSVTNKFEVRTEREGGKKTEGIQKDLLGKKQVLCVPTKNVAAVVRMTGLEPARL